MDVALLQSGKFQEALDGLAKWLTDTEDLVANQKPPSADYKVVKAQLQEQKVCTRQQKTSKPFIFPLFLPVLEENAPGQTKLHVISLLHGQRNRQGG